MRKKISVKNLKLGMFLDELCGSWMEHPFFNASFVLKKQTDLDAILSSSIREVWIDTSKGLDVESETTGTFEAKENKNTDKKLLQAQTRQTKHDVKYSFDEELDTARKILANAKKATTSMFQEARMGKAVKIKEASSLVGEISESISRNSGALISLARLKNKDDYTYMHSVAVCALMIALGRQMDFDSDLLHSLGMAGMLHDIGKMMIPQEILDKPGRLSDEEFDVIKSHPLQGWEVLKESEEVDEMALDVCLHHHERIDGRGYPHKLPAENLSIFSKMGAVCDVYDAITSNRSYKNGWEPAESIRKMAEWKDGHFDEDVFNAFVKTIGIYPTGSMVKLKSGRLAVVVEQSSKSLLTPKVKVFYSTNAKTHITKKIIDLSNSQEKIQSVEVPEKWGFDAKNIISQ